MVILAGAALFGCSEQPADLEPTPQITDAQLTKSVSALISDESTIEAVAEEVNYEVDFISTAESAINDYTNTLKSADLTEGYGFGYYYHFRKRYRNGICPNVNIAMGDSAFPKTMVIDYGDSTVLANGRVLSGTITISISAPMFTDGATRTVTFEDFSVDSIGIEGTLTRVYTGDGVTEQVFSCTSDLTFTLPDGSTLQRVSDKTRTWVAGLDTELDPTDDVIEITGSVQVTDSEGNEYSYVITSPLIKTGECRFITEGEITYSQNGEVFAVVDYGDGTCDNVVTVTTSDGTTEMTIREFCLSQKLS
jgi:hypothetical protein